MQNEKDRAPRMSTERRDLSASISNAARWFSGFGLILMTVIIAWQVFARYVLNDSPAWAEQAALFLMIWYVMFAAAAGVREDFHIRISVFADAFPGAAGKFIRILAHAVTGLFGAGMAIWGTELVLTTWPHAIPTLGLPRGVAYIPIPLSGLLIVGFSLERVLAEARNRGVRKLWS
jgi:TRAP-type C4-dicarboxylate transport system permease small subunit